MTEEKAPTKPALVVHLSAGGEPLLFALDPAHTTDVEKSLPQYLRSGTIESVHTKDGAAVTINFAHVAVAYVDDLHRKNRVFGLH